MKFYKIERGKDYVTRLFSAPPEIRAWALKQCTGIKGKDAGLSDIYLALIILGMDEKSKIVFRPVHINGEPRMAMKFPMNVYRDLEWIKREIKEGRLQRDWGNRVSVEGAVQNLLRRGFEIAINS